MTEQGSGGVEEFRQQLEATPRASVKLIFMRGVFSMGAALAIIYAAEAFVRAIPYPPARIASMFISITPGDFATAMIERFGHSALRGLSGGVHVVTLVFAGWVSVLIGRPEHPHVRARRSLGAAGVLFLIAMLLGVTAPGTFSFGAPAVYVIAALAFARLTLGEPLTNAIAPAIREGETPLDAMRRSRRRFIVRSVAAVGGFVLGGAGAVRFFLSKMPVNVEIAMADVPFRPPPDDPAFPKVPGHSSEITMNENFYTVDINLIKPNVDHESWRLRIHGRVKSPFTLDYRSLQSEFEVVEMAHTLTCISNDVGGDLISTAVWRGVRLKDVLSRAGLEGGTVDIVFRAEEGYTDSITIAKALEETTLVVFGMNATALPREHGFPVRMIVPGIYGMKNVKWLKEIEAVDHNYKGYWMVRGWSDIATVKTQSRIDVPTHGARVKIPSRVAGVAWAGDRGVSAVEISQDDGASWQPATVKRELAPLVWRLWAASLAPSPGGGKKKVLVRSTDKTGAVQEQQPTPPHPDGAAGYHAIELEPE